VIVTADSDVFSPNGDGNKDTVTIYQETSLEDTWTGSIRSDAGTLVREFSWIEKADAALTWDGRGADGLLLPDGSYTYTLESVDRAGNRGVSKPVAFVLDTEETPVILSVEADAFSPNADGIKDTIRILPEVKKPEGIESYSLSVLNAEGESVRTYTGRGKLPSSLVWDGLSDRGLKAPDGNYRAELRVRYVNGNEPETSSKLFLIDTVYPSVKAAADAQLFSPEGDGYKDVVTITHESSEENLWEGLILDAALNPVKQQFFKGRVPDILWDGLDDAGNRVPDGSYRWVVRSTDIAGNSGKAEVGPIRIDTRIPRLFVTTDVQAFSPNGDGRFEDIISRPWLP
jgi:flagellar hook assembly protein FlgD